MVEDLLDGERIADERQQSPPTTAVAAVQGIGEGHSLQDLGPEVVPTPTWPFSRGMGNGAEVWPGRFARRGIGGLLFGGGLDGACWFRFGGRREIRGLVRTSRRCHGRGVRLGARTRRWHDAMAP